MEIIIKKSNKGCSVSEINQVERLFGAKLPEDYKNFLFKYNGGEPETNVFHIREINNSCGVNEFLSCHEVIEEKKQLGNRIPEKVIPTAFAECGNLVCLSVEIDRRGVFFWDHELEDEEENLPSWKNMFYLADSFKAFLDVLRKFDPREIKLEPGQVKSVWIDPEFLKQIQKKQKE